MKREKKLLKNTGIYFIGTFAAKGLSFVLLPIYTAYLSTEEYGAADLVITTANLLLPIFTFQIVEAAFRYMLDCTDKDRNKVITNSLLIYHAGMMLSVVAFVITRFVVGYQNPYMWYLLLYMYFVGLGQLAQQLVRGMKRNADYAVSGILLTLIQGISNIVFILAFGIKEISLLLAPILAAVAVLLYLQGRTHVFSKFHKRDIDKQTQGKLLRFCIPLIPNQLSWWFLNSFGVYLLALTEKTTFYSGVMGVANKFPSLIVMINSIFTMAWQESSVEEMNAKDCEQYYSKMFNAFVRVQLSIVLLVLPAVNLYIKLLVHSSFQSALYYIPILILAAVFNAYGQFFGVVYTTAKHTLGNLKTTLLSAAVSIAFTLLFAPTYKLWAVSCVNLLAFLIMFIVRAIDTRRYFTISIQYTQMLWLMALVAVAVLAYYMVPGLWQIAVFLVSLILVYRLNRTYIHRMFQSIRSLPAFSKSQKKD